MSGEEEREGETRGKRHKKSQREVEEVLRVCPEDKKMVGQVCVCVCVSVCVFVTSPSQPG